MSKGLKNGLFGSYSGKISSTITAQAYYIYFVAPPSRRRKRTLSVNVKVKRDVRTPTK